MLVFSGWAAAQNADFNVTVNTGPLPPNSDTVFPGEPTSLRVTLSNNSTVDPLTGVGYSKALPNGAVIGLIINGASAINGDSGCVGGTLTTTPGSSGVTLSGLTVPPRQVGVPGTGECYLDLPVAAYSTNGSSTSVSYAINAGEVSSDQGVNATGGPQAITIRAVQRPLFSKSVQPNNILVVGGAARTLQITVRNADTNIALNNIAFTDVFPTSGPGGAIAEPTGAAATHTCPAGINIALTQGAAAQVAVSGLDLPPASACQIQVPIQGRQTDGVYQRTLTNTIFTSSWTADEGLTPVNNATAQLRVRSPLAVNKRFNPGIVASGEPNNFWVRLINNGNTPITVTNFTDDPIAAAPHQARMNIASNTDISNDCGGSASLESGGQGFSVGGFVIPANDQCQIDVTYTGITPGADEPTTYTNTIPAGAVQTPVLGLVSQARSATVLVADRLRVLKARAPANAAPGDPVRYTLTIQNFDPAPIANASVVDALQNGSSLLLGGAFAPTLTAGCGALGLNGAAQGDTSVTFTIPTVPARTGTNTPGVCVIEFSAMIAPGATTNTQNQVGTGNVCFGAGPTCNNVPSQNVNTVRLNPIALSKTFDGVENSSQQEGSPSRLRIQIDNNSINALTNLTFSDTFPTAGPFQQLRVANPPNVVNTCGGNVIAAPDSTSVALNNGTVPAYNGSNPGRCALELDVTAPAGTYPNNVDASAVRTNADGSTTLVTGSDPATVTFTDVLQVEKSFLPDEVGPNGRATAIIRLTSLDPALPITNIGFTDNLPAGMTVADPDNAYTTCNGATTVTAPVGAGSASLTGATLSPLAVCELRFDVTVSGTSDWVNTIPAGGVTADNGINNRVAASATLRYVPPDIPLISKAITPGTIVPGEAATLTINVTNGAQALTNVSVADYFTVDGLSGSANNGMFVAADPEASTDCPDGIVSATPGGNEVSLSGATLSAGLACQVTVRVTSTTVGTLTNTIPMNSIDSDQGATNSSTFAQSTLSTTSEVGVSKHFIPPVVAPSETGRLRITILNAQAEAVTGLSLRDDFPAGLVIATPANEFSNCGGGLSLTFPTPGSIQIDGGSIGPAIGNEAAQCVIEVDVTSAVEGEYLNEIPEDTLRANGNPVPHPPGRGRLRVRERLIVNKAFDNLTLDADDPVGFTTGTAVRQPGVPAPMTIRLENPNSVELTQVNFIDEMPDGLVLAQNPALATTCTNGSVVGVASGREVRLTGATLAATGEAGAVCTVTANVVSNIPGVYVNEIPAGDVTSFEGVENDPGTQARLIITRRPMLAKEFDPPVVAPNVNTTLRILIANDNLLPLALTAPLVDNLPSLPGQVTVANPSVVSTTCPGGNGIVTALAGATSVTVASGASVPSGGCEVTVAVVAPVPGDYLNRIPVGGLQTNFGVNEEPADGPLKSSTLGYIAGKVFLDPQAVPDGSYIPGISIPVAGNPIELRSGADCSGGVLDTTVTDGMGNYLFTELVAGTYSVCQTTQPDDSLNSISTAGTIVPVAGSTGTPGTATNPPGGTPTSQVAGIVLNNNGNADEVSGSPGNNFSEIAPASIAGNVYYDADNDGVFDPDEAGIGGVTVNLGGPVTASTTTAADGSYSFTGLPPGSYTVTETQPGAFADGLDTLGTVQGSGNGDDSVNDQFSAITLAPGQDGIEYNFGEILDGGGLALNANAYCDNNAVRIAYELPGFSGPGAGTPPPITLRFFTVANRLVEILPDQAAAGTLLWPGTAVDGADMGIAWPGWAAQGGGFVAVPDDRIPQIVLEAEVGGTVRVLLNYVAPSPACASQPPGTFDPDPEPEPIPALPFGLVWLLALLAGGYGLRRIEPERMRRHPL